MRADQLTAILSTIATVVTHIAHANPPLILPFARSISSSSNNILRLRYSVHSSVSDQVLNIYKALVAVRAAEPIQHLFAIMHAEIKHSLAILDSDEPTLPAMQEAITSLTFNLNVISSIVDNCSDRLYIPVFYNITPSPITLATDWSHQAADSRYARYPAVQVAVLSLLKKISTSSRFLFADLTLISIDIPQVWSIFTSVLESQWTDVSDGLILSLSWARDFIAMAHANPSFSHSKMALSQQHISRFSLAILSLLNHPHPHVRVSSLQTMAVMLKLTICPASHVSKYVYSDWEQLLIFLRIVTELVARLTDVDSAVREESFLIVSSLPQSTLSRVSIDSGYSSSLVCLVYIGLYRFRLYYVRFRTRYMLI